MERRLIVSALALSGAACTAHMPYEPHFEQRAYRGPEAGDTATVSVGEPIVTAYDHYSQVVATIDLTRLPAEALPKTYGRSVNGYFPAQEGGADGPQYMQAGEARMKAGGMSFCGNLGERLACFTDRDNDSVFDQVKFWTNYFTERGTYEVEAPYTTQFHVPGKSGFRKELVYQGRGQGTMHLLYREYEAGDLVRPAYTQELTYEVQDGRATVAFREVRVEVLSASNTEVTYRVTSQF